MDPLFISIWFVYLPSLTHICPHCPKYRNIGRQELFHYPAHINRLFLYPKSIFFNFFANVIIFVSIFKNNFKLSTLISMCEQDTVIYLNNFQRFTLHRRWQVQSISRISHFPLIDDLQSFQLKNVSNLKS